jgi:two-component system nitrogen regulation response regulator NtrX
MTPDSFIQAKDMPPPFNRKPEIKANDHPILSCDSYKEAKFRFEKAFIKNKLKRFSGNISQTAEAIGIERSNLHKKIKAYGLEDFKP